MPAPPTSSAPPPGRRQHRHRRCRLRREIRGDYVLRDAYCDCATYSLTSLRTRDSNCDCDNYPRRAVGDNPRAAWSDRRDFEMCEMCDALRMRHDAVHMRTSTAAPSPTRHASWRLSSIPSRLPTCGMIRHEIRRDAIDIVSCGMICGMIW